MHLPEILYVISLLFLGLASASVVIHPRINLFPLGMFVFVLAVAYPLFFK